MGMQFHQSKNSKKRLFVLGSLVTEELFVCRKLPFQEKHVLQQASILGNLEEFGVLKNSDEHISRDNYDSKVPAVIEFGAGRGYLTQMLADCYGIKKVFLVERKSYKLKVS